MKEESMFTTFKTLFHAQGREWGWPMPAITIWFILLPAGFLFQGLLTRERPMALGAGFLVVVGLTLGSIVVAFRHYRRGRAAVEVSA